MCRDTKICVKYIIVKAYLGLNTTEATSRKKHTSLFDKMAEHSWNVLEFPRNYSIVAVQLAFWWNFGRCRSPALSIWRWSVQFRSKSTEERAEHVSSGNGTKHVDFGTAKFHYHQSNRLLGYAYRLCLSTFPDK
jgi:hypothetical protein